MADKAVLGTKKGAAHERIVRTSALRGRAGLPLRNLMRRRKRFYFRGLRLANRHPSSSSTIPETLRPSLIAAICAALAPLALVTPDELLRYGLDYRAGLASLSTDRNAVLRLGELGGFAPTEMIGLAILPGKLGYTIFQRAVPADWATLSAAPLPKRRSTFNSRVFNDQVSEQ